ncbi:hypothetical protein ABB34_01980 [Stenotrophomonas daejeonensis]|uniref:Uncharacterized protein n=1 Tax=Stenotrophomonas daejeonensis TaxID=659018 RepID=A0A0R0E2K2_9GAMM|nr:hypothetical protein ABB34_01980 [Stenotrophomonas daejeonensis]
MRRQHLRHLHRAQWARAPLRLRQPDPRLRRASPPGQPDVLALQGRCRPVPLQLRRGLRRAGGCQRP